MSDEAVHSGHRQRMKHKFISHGQKIFDTYELLEMLLYNVIPYRDTNPIAKGLLSELGGLYGVLKAGDDRLVSVKGIGVRAADLIGAVGEVASVIGAELLPTETPVLNDYDVIGSYLVSAMKSVTENSVGILLLTNGLRPIAFETLYKLDFGSAGVRPGKFIDAALKYGAPACITVNARPYGAPTATMGDKATFKAINNALTAAGVEHINHYVVAGDYYKGIATESYAFAQRVNGRNLRINTIGRALGDFADEKRVETRDILTDLLAFATADPVEVSGRLLSRYLTVENVITASFEELSDIAGDRVAMLLKISAAVISRSGTDRFAFGVRHTDEDIVDYFKSFYIGVSVETISLMTIDSSGRVTSNTIVAEGTVNSSAIVPRRFLEVAKRAGAKKVVIAHNHPFGNTSPSGSDRAFTAELYEMFASAGIRLAAHYIVAGQQCSGMRYVALGGTEDQSEI